MQLGVVDRFAILNVLPEHGDFTTLKIVRELREQLSFTEEEHARLDFQQTEDGRTVWRENLEREYDFGKKAEGIIRDALSRANKQNKLTIDHLNVYEMFVGDDDD